MERQHWCSYCLIPFKNKYSLRGHLYIHAKQPRVPCSICPLTFTHYSQLGKHLRYMHSDYIINTFVENAESIYRKDITGITPGIESGSEWADSSEEETITSSEEENISEDTDSENVEESVENFSNETQYILATNVNDVSDNKNTVGEFVSKGVNTKHMNNSLGHNRNVKSCDVSFLVELERGKAGIHHLNITRNISNSKDNSKRHILQQHMESEFLSTDDRVSFQRPRDGNTDPDLRDEDPPEKTPLQTEQNIQQTPWADLDREEKEQLDYGEMIAMIGQDGVNDEEELIKINEDQEQTPWADLDREEKEQLDYGEMIAMIGQDGVNDEEELIKINEDQELAVADVVYNPGQSVWTEAIDILKATFMKKKKIARVRGMFASTNTVTFTKWLPANFPVEGVMCGCGRHLKTPNSLLAHLRRKSSADRKNVKLFKKGI
ncbi:mediator of RNA polymerase II transcription subunit 12-like isoform X2 [Mytilus edulis]|uniref:mediator of RNA polymerase II transcription subunit 12-like isoform X2 n=1 Tax=Mytilus edulis TaxID=6550 RepID=UPI0039EF95B6